MQKSEYILILPEQYLYTSFFGRGISMKEKPKVRYNEFPKEDILDSYMNAVCSGDCTGLIPSGNCDCNEKFCNYKDLYSFSVPVKPQNCRPETVNKADKEQ